MKLNRRDSESEYVVFIEFESEDEIEAYCKFFFNNDYFVKKAYNNLDNYCRYIRNINNGDLWTDCKYHYKLIFELKNLLDIKNIRKQKLKQINEV